jgi:hypothetical protein
MTNKYQNQTVEVQWNETKINFHQSLSRRMCDRMRRCTRFFLPIAVFIAEARWCLFTPALDASSCSSGVRRSSCNIAVKWPTLTCPSCTFPLPVDINTLIQGNPNPLQCVSLVSMWGTVSLRGLKRHIGCSFQNATEVSLRSATI